MCRNTWLSRVHVRSSQMRGKFLSNEYEWRHFNGTPRCSHCFTKQYLFCNCCFGLLSHSRRYFSHMWRFICTVEPKKKFDLWSGFHAIYIPWGSLKNPSIHRHCVCFSVLSRQDPSITHLDSRCTINEGGLAINRYLKTPLLSRCIGSVKAI